MLFAILLALLAMVFVAYFLYLFFYLNKSERLLQETMLDIEATMLTNYGHQRSPEGVAPAASVAVVKDLLKEKPKAPANSKSTDHDKPSAKDKAKHK